MPAATPRLVAHRFGRAYGPDSAPSTLAHALTGPVDGLETDCCLTADGRLALLHSPYLAMGTTIDGWVHERTGAEIAGARLRDRRGAVVDEHPLLLEDLWPLLEQGGVADGFVVQLEVKAVADGDLAGRTAAAICASLAATPPPPGVRIEVISFWPRSLPVAAAAGWDTRAIIATPYTPEAFAAWALDQGVTGVILEAPFWSAPHVDVWREAGLSLMSGVCNDAGLAGLVLPHQPDAFATDRPHELRAELAAQPS
ncbi:MAG TPA: glycerophosphodiester phosphodiesterase family protein [Aquihabitans sp.]|nr:glycerophosphodiester phosphodiesterase family protein [Aquihabitans sp.]